MPADPALEYQDADEARPAKRVRLDGALDVTEEVQEEIVDDDGWDDIYGDVEGNAGEEVKPSATEMVVGSRVEEKQQEPMDELDLEDAVPEVIEASAEHTLPLAPHGEHAPEQTEPDAQQEQEKAAKEDGVPVEAIDGGEELVDQQHNPDTADEPSLRMLEELSGVNEQENANLEGAEGRTNTNGELVQPVENAASLPQKTLEIELREHHAQMQASGGASIGDGDNKAAGVKATDDADFMAAAAAQKSDEKAEWQFDPSDAESSSSDSDSDSDSDSTSDSSDESEGGYEMLDPATAAKILMSGEGDDDDGDGKSKKGGSGADHQPRTANEVKEEVVPKPQVVVTPEMKITELGTVDRVVENHVLIKGSTPGEYQVLESGSVLCSEDRQVIGAVADTFGRVQEPMYSVAFASSKEVEEAGLEHGVKVYYVDSHSTFVFTQPLKDMKGTDASNLNDEEVGEDEAEFSDDEKEAEYKRMKKMAKKCGRGGRGGGRGGMDGHSFGAPGHDSGQTYINGAADAPQQGYGGGGLSYDDDDEAPAAGEEFYSPLKRPDNLSQMMAGGAAPLPPKPQHSGFDRGRGRGRGDRGRGRGDRGRGRGGGGRGGYDRDQRGDRHGGDRGGRGGGREFRGNAHSFPDRHNNEPPVQTQPGVNGHSLPPKPAAGRPPQQQPPAQQHQYQQPSAYAQPQQQPSTYQFNGYTFQYGNAPPQQPHPAQSYGYPQPQPQAYQQHHQPQTPGGGIPAGAYVNPAFFQQQQPQAQAGWQNQQYGYGGAQVPQQQLTGQQQGNLADILRRMGGGQ